MALGPGKYDALCTHVRDQTQAEGVLLIVTNGKHGSGFSMQAPIDLHVSLPAILESLADTIRNDWLSGENAGPMTDHHTTAFTMLTIGKAAGLLSRDDIRAKVLEALRDGTLSRHYIVMLRDRLNDVLRAGDPIPTEPNA